MTDRKELTDDERRTLASDEAYARATGSPRRWALLVDRDGNQSIATVFTVKGVASEHA